MTIQYEKSLRYFEFWAGAKEHARYFSPRELDLLEETIFADEVWEETAVNDMFWFEPDYLATALGYADFEELMAKKAGEES